MIYGTFFRINDQEVPCPDQEAWSDVVIGQSLDGTQKRSPWKRLEWTKRVDNPCDQFEWFAWDNTTLTSLTTRARGYRNVSERYTDAICVSVTAVQSHGNMTDITATFLVNP